jgi:hypothetical protein
MRQGSLSCLIITTVYVSRLKQFSTLIASAVQLHGDHLMFMNPKGQLTASISEELGSELEYAAQ